MEIPDTDTGGVDGMDRCTGWRDKTWHQCPNEVLMSN